VFKKQAKSKCAHVTARPLTERSAFDWRIFLNLKEYANRVEELTELLDAPFF